MATVGELVDKALVDTMADKLSEIKAETLGYTLGHCQQEFNFFPFPSASLTVFLLTGAFHIGPVLVPCCI